MVKYEVLFHASIRIEYNGQIIYFDPFKVNKEYKDATIVFVTHSHYDHYSEKDIKLVDNDKTHYVMPLSMKNDISYPNKDKVLFIEPDKSYEICGIKFDVVYSYNKHKLFHRKANKWVGYILTLDNEKYYIMGDTDENEDVLKVKADYIFIPIGGTYTFDAKDAASYINKVTPKVAIPIHYGKIINSKPKTLDTFVSSVNKNIKIDAQLKED